MNKKLNTPAEVIQDLQNFGEYGGVNPSISDSSTFTYLEGNTMEDVFEGEERVVIYTLDIRIHQPHIFQKLYQEWNI